MKQFDVDLDPSSLAQRLSGRRRVLFVGSPGSGKSSLAAQIAAVLAQQGAACTCIGGDPGSPAFGVPGAVCLGGWTASGWECTDLEPLCTLDAGRFRLPLIQALGRLMKRVPQHQIMLVDGPGVVRGAAAAELLSGFAQSAGIDAILALQGGGESPALEEELRAFRLFVVRVRPAPEARRPGKGARNCRRTGLWNKYLEQSSEYRIDLNEVASTGTPPPREVPSAWAGRQIVLIDGQRCAAFGEVRRLDGHALAVKLCGDPREAQAILIRDAMRHTDGLLRTAELFGESTTVSPPPDMSGTREAQGRKAAAVNNASPIARSHQVTAGEHLRTAPEPRPVAHVGAVTAILVNGVFGDPLLHVRLQHQRRSLLFDLGESWLPARIAHQGTDVFISHTHVDHIAGFVWLLRSRIGNLPACRIFGPPGSADNIMGFVRGIHWDRVGERAPRFEVVELNEQQVHRYLIQAGKPQSEIAREERDPEGILLRDAAFQVRGTTLDHRTPVLAFALELKFDLNVRRERVASLGLTAGPWLSDLKLRIASGERDTTIVLPNGATQTAGQIADEILIVRPGPRLVYATDLADTAGNRIRLQRLAKGAHTFFCDSRRYQDEPARVYAEVRARGL